MTGLKIAKDANIANIANIATHPPATPATPTPPLRFPVLTSGGRPGRSLALSEVNTGPFTPSGP